MPLKRGYGMGVAQEVSRGLPRDAVGPARTIAFGTSIVAGSLCCALSIGEFAGRVPSAGWGLHVQQPRVRPGRGFPDRLDDDLR